MSETDTSVLEQDVNDVNMRTAGPGLCVLLCLREEPELIQPETDFLRVA